MLIVIYLFPLRKMWWFPACSSQRILEKFIMRMTCRPRKRWYNSEKVFSLFTICLEYDFFYLLKGQKLIKCFFLFYFRGILFISLLIITRISQTIKQAECHIRTHLKGFSANTTFFRLRKLLDSIIHFQCDIRQSLVLHFYHLLISRNIMTTEMYNE